MNYQPGTASYAGLAHCHYCLKLTPADQGRCPRCHASLHKPSMHSIDETLALLFTSAILMIPANVMPMTVTDQMGSSINSTILGGVILIWKLGSYPIAVTIFVASFMVPLGKILGLGYLCLSIKRGRRVGRRERAVLYRVVELLGRWSMIDVFVVTILVALVRLQGLITFHPGNAALALAGVVIITMIAAERFDARLIWQWLEQQDE